MGWTFNPFSGTFDNTGPATSPAGSDTHVQYNDSGSFGGDANNTWNKTTKIATLTNAGLGATTTAVSQRLVNTTAATSGVRAQVSPAIQWRGNGWKNNSVAASQTVDFNAYVVPAANATSAAYGTWRLDYSMNGAAASRGLEFQSSFLDGLSVALFRANGLTEITANNSSTIDTLQNLDLVNTSGSKTHFTFTFGSTIRYGISNDTNGNAEYKTAGSSPVHNFYTGSSITSQQLTAQIYGNGIYNSYSNFNNGVVTAGSADTTAQTSLSAYGSFAVKGVLVNSSSYTLAATETFVYCDPSYANFCTGTPTACNTYLTQTPCDAHAGVGCTWFAGNACSAFNGDTGSCTGQAGCSLETSSCATAGNNTDQSTCENQDDAFGGSCSWDTSTCPAQTSTAACNAITGCTASETNSCSVFTDTSSCNAQTPCSAVVDGDCTALSDGGGDGTSCATQPECSYDNGTGACTGLYFTACSGSYFDSCSGNLCAGNFNTGNCNGTYGAECQGTASCSNLTDDGSTLCNAESGCAWTVGITVTLPTTTNALRGTTGRVYSVVHVGDTGTCSIQGQSGENIFQYGSTLTLFKKGDKVLLHNQNIAFPCSNFSSQTPCNAQSPCVWQPVISCSSYNGNQSGCESNPVSNYCSWDSNDSTCNGAGNATAFCGPSGTNYNSTNRWYAHSMERGLNYVEKTANYTVTDIDDVVNCTSGTFTLTLPSASLNNGKTYYLKNTGSGTITVDGNGSQTIDGNLTVTLTTGDSLTIVSNNSNWIIT